MSQVVMFIMEGKITALGLPEVLPFRISAVLQSTEKNTNDTMHLLYKDK